MLHLLLASSVLLLLHFYSQMLSVRCAIKLHMYLPPWLFTRCVICFVCPVFYCSFFGFTAESDHSSLTPKSSPNVLFGWMGRRQV
ncbi:hypothetical protein B0H16DRAFT_382812 [Mycena metata]|uniref:Secreted peptide n=1 Tax=Mycena metata TaxID=1033252 RepID=A0AAD7HHG7_9AGAR|nr:hypothetical protein B0H16DRAFT_382812 [Mycena metata]